MQRPAFSQSPNRVGSGPSRPPISRGSTGWGGCGGAAGSAAPAGGCAVSAVGTESPSFDFMSAGEFARSVASVPEAVVRAPALVCIRIGRNMIEESTQALRTVLLPGFGVLRFAGPDAAVFLQGQFTNDVRLLADGRTQVSACCTNQGRVIAVVRLRQTDEAIYALLPADLMPRLATHLRKYLLRAKVEILQATDLVVGAVYSGAAAETAVDRAFDEAALTLSPVPLAGATEIVTFQYAPGREVVAAPAAAWRTISGLSLGRPSPQAHEDWLAADVADGLTNVFAATSGQFIPQMLNLDLLDGVSFAKGCYTGQEIVARTHHLGRVKRRTMRFVLPPGEAPAPLAPLLLDGAKVAEVLMTATRSERVELLAVTSLEATGKTLVAADGRVAEPRSMAYGVAGVSRQ
jgi:folate-binding protein YgfZ